MKGLYFSLFSVMNICLTHNCLLQLIIVWNRNIFSFPTQYCQCCQPRDCHHLQFY